jgi:hypothetical protein
MNRWRGRTGGLTIAAALVVVLSAVAALGGRQGSELVVRGLDGSQLASVQLPSDGGFRLRYRNSIYGSLVEEVFVVTPDGRLRLVRLAAEEVAVLEEYYAVDGPAVRQPAGSSMAWEGKPSLTVEQDSILIAATDLGERTLVVDGASPLELWRLVDDAAPSVWLGLQR